MILEVCGLHCLGDHRPKREESNRRLGTVLQRGASSVVFHAKYYYV